VARDADSRLGQLERERGTVWTHGRPTADGKDRDVRLVKAPDQAMSPNTPVSPAK
jgi:hypothetical protein